MTRPSIRRRFARLLALSALAAIASCGSAPEIDDGRDRGVTVVGASLPIDPEAERAEMARARTERRRVVESTLRWIVGETEERAAPPR